MTWKTILPLRRPVLKTLLCCSFFMSLSVYSLGVRPLVVVGASMEPALFPGQLTLLQRNYYETHSLQPGDVIAFYWQGRTYVKRVHALEGEPVTLLYSDGECWPVSKEIEARERRLLPRLKYARLRSEVVPPGHFFCLGDNTNASVDSRQLGPILTSAILGRVGF